MGSPQKMDHVVIRDATLGDASAIASLATQLGYHASAAESRDRLADILASDEHAVIVACLPDGTAVGWVHVFLALRIESDRFAELGGFIVSELHRRKGLGRRLVTAAAEWASNKCVTKLRVRSRVERAEAKVFFQRMGFSGTKEQRVFDKLLKGNA